MADDAKQRRVLVNDDGWIMGGCEPPLTPRDFEEEMVATYKGTPVDTLFWSVGGSEIYCYETAIGDIFGRGCASFANPFDRNTHANIQGLMKDHGGPLEALVRVCRQAGMDLFPSLRMNQHYEMEPESPRASRMRRDHPEWLIGFANEELTPGSMEWGIRTGLNFAVPEVRAYLESIICELFECFEVAGVELDFMRHPGYFRIDEAYSSRYLITDLLRRVRARMDVVGREKGRRVELAVRVPETLDAAVRIGLDVAPWIEEKLVDMVVVGGGFVPFGMNIKEFVEVGRGSACRVYGCMEAMRPAAADEVIAAIASRIWHSGADGIYLFNYHGRSSQWKRRMLNRIAAPESLTHLDKRYEIDHADRVMSSGQISGAFRYGHPPIQLPATLDRTHADTGIALQLLVADDFEAASREGHSARCTLRLRLERFTATDRLKVLLNRAELPWKAGVISREEWSVTTYGDAENSAIRTKWRRAPWYFAEIASAVTVVEFLLGWTLLKQGENELRVALIGQASSKTEPVVLRDVELDIRFG